MLLLLYLLSFLFHLHWLTRLAFLRVSSGSLKKLVPAKPQPSSVSHPQPEQHSGSIKKKKIRK
jgi:hypothetical protein